MTTTPDFRAELQRLVDLYEALGGDWSPHGYTDTWNDALVEALTALATPPPEPLTLDLGPEWQPCVKLPITVHVREQQPGETHSSTREGITPLHPDDLIMRGVQGEEYPIGRELFTQTYRMGETLATPPPGAPTDEELWAFWNNHDGPIPVILRAALERWGHR